MIIINAYDGVTDEARLLKKRFRIAGIKTSIAQAGAAATKTNVVINWAESHKILDDLDLYSIVFNYSRQAAKMANRQEFLFCVGLKDNVVDWTTLPMVAAQWATGRNKIICHFDPKELHRPTYQLWCQDDGVPLPLVPLYTRYTDRTAEYRVHLARSWGAVTKKVFFVERKIFAPTPDNPYPRKIFIRNSKNGFHWMRNLANYPVPEEVLHAATDACRNGFPHLHFCAIDVLYHADKKQAWVLKGTTAPKLIGSVADAYAEYFIRSYRDIMERNNGTSLHPSPGIHPQDPPATGG